MYIITETPSQALELATNYVVKNGKPISPRGMTTYEILNANIEITKPWNIPLEMVNRRLNQEIGANEALQLVGQTTDPEIMSHTSKVFNNFMDEGVFHGAYGPRIHGNLTKLVNQLKKDPSTRQGVLTIFDSGKDLNTNVKDIPCTLTLQYFIRENKLFGRTSMRSNDVFLGMPYDFVQFIALQGAIAKALDIEMGTYSHTVGSMHIYEKHMLESEFIEANEDIELQFYTPLWSANTIGSISSTARLILKGSLPDYPTAFERFLGDPNG